MKLFACVSIVLRRWGEVNIPINRSYDHSYTACTQPILQACRQSPDYLPLCAGNADTTLPSRPTLSRLQGPWLKLLSPVSAAYICIAQTPATAAASRGCKPNP